MPPRSLITSLTFAAIAAVPRRSRPMVTRYTWPPKCRRTRGSAQASLASVVLPNPPAPVSAVVTATTGPEPCFPVSAVTIRPSSAGRSMTQSSTVSSGGMAVFGRGASAHTAATAAATAVGKPATAAHTAARSGPDTISTISTDTQSAAPRVTARPRISLREREKALI